MTVVTRDQQHRPSVPLSGSSPGQRYRPTRRLKGSSRAGAFGECRTHRTGSGSGTRPGHGGGGQGPPFTPSAVVQQARPKITGITRMSERTCSRLLTWEGGSIDSPKAAAGRKRTRLPVRSVRLGARACRWRRCAPRRPTHPRSHRCWASSMSWVTSRVVTLRPAPSSPGPTCPFALAGQARWSARPAPRSSGGRSGRARSTVAASVRPKDP